MRGCWINRSPSQGDSASPCMGIIITSVDRYKLPKLSVDDKSCRQRKHAVVHVWMRWMVVRKSFDVLICKLIRTTGDERGGRVDGVKLPTNLRCVYVRRAHLIFRTTYGGFRKFLRKFLREIKYLETTFFLAVQVLRVQCPEQLARLESVWIAM